MSDRIALRCPRCGDVAMYSPTLAGAIVVCNGDHPRHGPVHPPTHRRPVSGHEGTTDEVCRVCGAALDEPGAHCDECGAILDARRGDAVR